MTVKNIYKTKTKPIKAKKKDKIKMTDPLKELKEEYKQKLKDDPTQEGSDAAWKWFIKERKKLDEDYDAIFRVLMVEPREIGMDLYYDYILDNITIVEYFWGLVNDTGQLYMNILVEEELVEDENIYDILEDVSLQALKGTDTIGKLEELPDRNDPEQQELRDEIDRVGSVIWWNFVEELHGKIKEVGDIKIPKVKKMQPFLYTAIQVEADVIESDDFDEFKLSSEEEEYYKGEVGLNG